MTETSTPQTIPEDHSTDKALSMSPRATALAAMLLKEAPFGAPELVAYRGALTPKRLDEAGKETVKLEFEAAVHDLGWLRRVAVRGEDRFRWLNGMVTNTVNDLGANSGAWNLVLNAQGRILGDLHVWREGDALELVIAADQYDRILAHLERFIIMDDVELVPLGEETALGFAGPTAANLMARIGLPAPSEPMSSVCSDWKGQTLRIARTYGVSAPHYELWVKATRLPLLWNALVRDTVPVGAATLEAFRIAEGIPAYGIDIAERDLPQETSQMRALSFNKGCYLGQEIVERIRSRGAVHRHLRQLELFGPVPVAGTELTLEGGAVAGQITSAAQLPLYAGNRGFALGMIRAEAEVRNQPLHYLSGEATYTADILNAPPKLGAAD